MFEQSILIDHTGARKTGAFALSLTAQILLGGVLLLTPLIYQDALPIVRVSTIVPMPAMPREPEPPRTETVATSQRLGLALPNVFRPPTYVPQGLSPTGPTIIENEAPGLAPISVGLGDGLPIGMGGPIQVERPPTLAPRTAAIPEPMRPLPVSGGVQSAKLLKQVIPIYPDLAKRMRASGTVRLLGIIGKDGRIQNLQVLSGHPLLTQAALDAVRQWVYSPTILSGNPVDVEAPIDVIFTLSR